MLVLLIGFAISKTEIYSNGIRVPCDYIDNCEACAYAGGSKIKSSCLICVSGYYLELDPETNSHVCKLEPTPEPETPTPVPETPESETSEPETSEPETPTPEPETPEPEPEIPDNCPPCVCDAALKSSTSSSSTNHQYTILLVLQCVTLFMVSYLFFKTWKPIVCQCPRKQENPPNPLNQQMKRHFHQFFN
ncbi:hypothetical protein TRFO_41592 [Tritrichomonas foetus]|uniref:Uncharacterized protein n=1 Tax=Tritrichomonas foetus TaxID=1144522 RepID=A0A1J4L482_9EUKA|nr:hypothetical protein TRFO_41592 [Tritrichomonas foetus]|eukprot:OHT16758.1 hypothetical protein TRFO_41592 [Tritrichomonas foetus]